MIGKKDALNMRIRPQAAQNYKMHEFVFVAGKTLNKFISKRIRHLARVGHISFEDYIRVREINPLEREIIEYREIKVEV
jgi:hypothetical protein